MIQLRNENFEVCWEIEEGMSDNLVFPFMFQPIVENAIFHGIGPMQRNGTIRITLRTEDGHNVAVIS